MSNDYDMKKCSRCGEMNGYWEFYAKKGMCKSCISKIRKNHYKYNKEKIKVRRKERYKINIYKERLTALILRGGETNITAQDLQKLREENGFCYYCTTEFEDGELFTFDHKMPISKGGKNELDNLVICCHRCNSMKQNMTEEEFQEKQKVPF